jgi:glycosyltransferase involved in cell wall biosynthesis
MKTISVVIPAYNEERTIERCIQSVLRAISTLNCDVEVVVVNNASTDETAAIARRCGVRVIDEHKKGLTKARQAGYLASKGEWIAYFDADCIVPSEWFPRAIADMNSSEDIVAVSGRNYFFDMSPFMHFATYLAYCLSIRSKIQGGHFLVRRSALDAIGGFDTTIKFYGEDSDISRRLSEVGTVYFDFDLYINTSGRRFMHEGIIKTAIHYLFNLISVYILHRPFHSVYNDVRIDSRKQKRRSAWIPRFS